MTTKIKASNIEQATLENIGGGPKISNVQIANSSYGIIDDTAVSLSGGFIVINGTGFASGCQVIVGNTAAISTTFANSSIVRAQVAAADAGTKPLYVVNVDGGTAIRVNGLTHSATPTWVTGSTLTEGVVDEAISIQLDASLATSYQLQAGSSLPAGLSLAANGLLTGTVTGIQNETTYSFTIEAIDAENQESPRSFSITITVGDPYFYLTTLLLNGDGTNGANNNTFVDSSTNNLAITRNGNPTQGTFSPFSAPDDRWSAYFDGSGDYLSVPGNAAFQFPGDLTLEAWIFWDGTESGGGREIYATGGSGSLDQWGIFSGLLYFAGIASSTSPPTNRWVHIAVTRSGSTIRHFIDGVQSGSGTNGSTIGSTTNTLFIGVRGADLQHPWAGYISNFRIVKGTAVYTSNFTPSTSPLTAITNTSLLTCQSNRFKDNSTNNFAITRNGDVKVTSFSPFKPTGLYSTATNGGSGYFDGSGDYLTSSGSQFTFGTGNFTIEMWVYPTALPSSDLGFFVDTRPSGTNNGFALWMVQTSGYLGLYDGPSGAGVDSTTPVPLNTWSHVALVRNGSSLTAYFNGINVASRTTSSNQTGTSLFIGTARDNPGVSRNHTGYISNLRIVKGTAVYTSNFTPPTSLLTSISNTSILCNFTNGGIIDYTGKNNLETVGTSRIDTSVKKYGTGSIILSPGGGSHYTKMPLTEELKFGTGDFTIECWIYLITNPAGICAVWSNYSSFSAGSLSLFAGHSSANINLFHIAHNGGFPALSSSTTVNSRLGTWTHLAVVRYNGQIKLYINGTSEGTPFASTVALNGVGTSFWVGTTGDSTAANPNCYIDDFRVTKGIARYTSNFTPPTSAHRLR